MPVDTDQALGAAAAELYRMVSGQQLLAEEAIAVHRMLKQDVDGKWSEPTCRGWFSGAVLEARALAGAFLLGEHRIVWSTYAYPSTHDAFRRLRDLIDGAEALRLQVKSIRAARGEERILLRDGRLMQFTHRAYSRYGRGRGLSADCLLLDEAGRGDLEDALAAYAPVLAGKPNGQLVVNHG